MGNEHPPQRRLQTSSERFVVARKLFLLLFLGTAQRLIVGQAANPPGTAFYPMVNLFFLDATSLARGVKQMCDQHVVKICLEACQALHQAWILNARGAAESETEIANMWEAAIARVPRPITLGPVYRQSRAFHAKHPVVQWVARSEANYMATAHYGLEICKVYTMRFGKTHSCEGHLEWLRDVGFPPKSPAAIEHVRDVELVGNDDLKNRIEADAVVATTDTQVDSTTYEQKVVFAEVDFPFPDCTPFPLCMERECIVRNSSGQPSCTLSTQSCYRFKDEKMFAMRYRVPHERPEWLGPVRPKPPTRAMRLAAQKAAAAKAREDKVAQKTKSKRTRKAGGDIVINSTASAGVTKKSSVKRALEQERRISTGARRASLRIASRNS